MAPRVSDEYKKQKRNELLEAAKRVFIRKGYELTTMKDIIKEAGVSQGGIYLYFSSTEEIFLALMSESDHAYLGMVQKQFNEGQSIWEHILALLEEIQHKFLVIQEGLGPVIYEYFFTRRRNEQADSLLKQRLQNAVACVSTLIDQGIEKGEFHPLYSAEEIALFFLSFFDGLVLNILHDDDAPWTINRQFEQIAGYLKYVLAVRS